MIRVDAVSKTQGGDVVLAEVSFDVARGEAVALSGPAAGARLLLRILATLVRPSSGRASVDGADVVTRAFTVRREVVLAGATVAAGDLSVSEYLQLIQRSRGGRGQPSAALIEMSTLSSSARLGALTMALRHRLDILAAVAASPKVVLLEEPIGATADDSRAFVDAALAELKARGITVLAAAHPGHLNSARWDRTIVLAGSRVHEAVIA